MMAKRKVVANLISLLMLGNAFAGTTCTDGVMHARPVKDGKAPIIDGKLDDWDLSGVVRCWNAEAYSESQNCSLALMYDEEGLYLGYKMTLPGRAAYNPNRPQDRYWLGDLVQFRLCLDPKIPYPLPNANRRDPNSFYVKNPVVNCVNVWKNSRNGEDYLCFSPGALFDCPSYLNPEGSEVKIITEGETLVAEAKIPWKALGVKSGKSPFAKGEKMPAIFDIKWYPGKDGSYTAAVYHSDPGAFAFLNQSTWGLIAFDEPSAPALAAVPTYAEIAAKARAGASAASREGARIAFTLPKKAKVSVNILDEKGWVVRELAGGELHGPGEVEFFWDGRDALGFPCETGKIYRWGAYAHDGLDALYFGTAGTSGEPPYETPNGKGCWGGDHGPVIAAAADETGRYFVWHGAEAGKAIVKTDYEGKSVWRATPFVAGCYGYFTAATAKDGILYLVTKMAAGTGKASKEYGLVRVDVKTGDFMLYPNNSGIAKLGMATEGAALPPESAIREEFAFNCAGLAVIGDEVFAGDYIGGCIRVVDAKTGAAKRTIPCAGVRGLAATADGKLLAACLPAAVVSLDPQDGAAKTLLTAKDGLESPYGIATDADDAIFVTDLGTSHQVKCFKKNWFGNYRLDWTFGKKGGRKLLGALDFGGLSFPFGLAVDCKGGLTITEAAVPKIVRVIDAKTRAERHRWFGYTSYSPSIVPDCDDPLKVYYSLSGPDTFARAQIPAKGGVGLPDACWDFVKEGFGGTGCGFNTMTMPQIFRAANGLKYFVTDSPTDYRDKGRPMIICKIDGDSVLPSAAVLGDEKKRKSFWLWADENGDGLIQENELSKKVERVAGREFHAGDGNGVMYVDDNFTLFLATQDNFIVGVPFKEFTACGAPKWDVDKAYIAIPQVEPDIKGKMWTGWRGGILGTRRDSKGNFFTAVNCSPEYVTPEYTKYMHQGMGHTADMGAIFITRHDAQGNPVWRVGRKAVGGIRDGEMLHHWCIAGMVGDGYVVVASEWGVFTVYTADGFYVDRFFDAPGIPGRGIPYSFGGEDFSGRIQYFKDRDEVWAYNSGHVFRVTGFEKGRVKGEWRSSGTVMLEKILPLVFPGSKERALTGVKLTRENGKVVFTAHVADSTPIINVARGAANLFKGGDAVGYQIGPSNAFKELPMRRPDGRHEGFVRILAAKVGEGTRVFAFAPFVTKNLAHRPIEYATPAGGMSAFEFVGEVPDATFSFVLDADLKGYAARVEVPESFFAAVGLDLAKDVYFDAEALFSGDGGRGLQTVRREWLYTPDSSGATMVDDVPTESRLRPEGWRRVEW